MGGGSKFRIRKIQILKVHPNKLTTWWSGLFMGGGGCLEEFRLIVSISGSQCSFSDLTEGRSSKDEWLRNTNGIFTARGGYGSWRILITDFWMRRISVHLAKIQIKSRTLESKSRLVDQSVASHMKLAFWWTCQINCQEVATQTYWMYSLFTLKSYVRPPRE